MPKYTAKPEHVLQASVAQFFRKWLPADMPFSAVDHGITFRGSAMQRMNEWNRLVARGVEKGIHDLPVIFYRGRLHSIELKKPGEEATAEQVAWGAKVEAQGGTWDVCSSRAEVWASMCRAFPDDNPLKPPPAILQWWLAMDDAAPKARVVWRSKPVAAKPTARTLAKLAKARAAGVLV
jgi:hypothetical protein